mmetsp:Transcript_48002/g.104481  ORF Transcript_48002/g.104481 Transcript_48002/m.104481 type:complete len:532 (+) Transcript_48002:71-1666(+)
MPHVDANSSVGANVIQACLADACLDGEADQIREVLLCQRHFLAGQQEIRRAVELELQALTGDSLLDVNAVIGEYQELQNKSPNTAEAGQSETGCHVSQTGVHAAKDCINGSPSPSKRDLVGVPQLRRFVPARTYASRAEASGDSLSPDASTKAPSLGSSPGGERGSLGLSARSTSACRGRPSSAGAAPGEGSVAGMAGNWHNRLEKEFGSSDVAGRGRTSVQDKVGPSHLPRGFSPCSGAEVPDWYTQPERWSWDATAQSSYAFSSPKADGIRRGSFGSSARPSASGSAETSASSQPGRAPCPGPRAPPPSPCAAGRSQGPGAPLPPGMQAARGPGPGAAAASHPGGSWPSHASGARGPQPPRPSARASEPFGPCAGSWPGQAGGMPRPRAGPTSMAPPRPAGGAPPRPRGGGGQPHCPSSPPTARTPRARWWKEFGYCWDRAPPRPQQPQPRASPPATAAPALAQGADAKEVAKLEARLQELARLPRDEQRKGSKELLVKWHPDKNITRGPEATRVFQWLQNRKKELLGF